ncbi:MAG TPA: type 1 glutamine amidotransferase [Polyangiaceae bacterium]|nr:type 1 glutamine amidotransferase [Polyangiaceae bacterium]
MSTRPVVGISGPDRGGWTAWFFASAAIRAAGGRPVRLTPRRGLRQDLDALVLGGGADVEPARYGQAHAPQLSRELQGHSARGKLRALAGYALAPVIYLLRRLLSVQTAGVDRDRDQLETALLEHAVARKLPVLGICRGSQLLNVHRGGTLHQDVGSFYVERPNPWTVFPAKRVRIAEGSRLGALLGRHTCQVNSLHRQAVAHLGDGLTAVAAEPNGVVQAIEDSSHPFFVGVQWHPEYMPQRPEQRRLFRELVAAARAARQANRSAAGLLGAATSE